MVWVILDYIVPPIAIVCGICLGLYMGLSSSFEELEQEVISIFEGVE